MHWCGGPSCLSRNDQQVSRKASTAVESVPSRCGRVGEVRHGVLKRACVRSRERVRVAQPGSPRLWTSIGQGTRIARPPPCLPCRCALCDLCVLRTARVRCALQGAMEAVIRPARLISPDCGRSARHRVGQPLPWLGDAVEGRRRNMRRGGRERAVLGEAHSLHRR